MPGDWFGHTCATRQVAYMTDNRIIQPFWTTTGIVSGFSLASSGDASVPVDSCDMGINTLTDQSLTARNRADMLQALMLPSDSLAWAKQVHGNEVLYVDQPGLTGEADGLVTDVPGVSLGIMVADCAAILVADPVRKIIGAFHAGWRGAVTGIVEHGISHMKQLGANDLYAWMSPCIGIQAFEVGAEVASRFPEKFIHSAGFDKPHIDLKQYLVEKLEVAGLQRDRISVDMRCTYDDTTFFSYRRQGKQSGRMMAVIAIK